MLQKAWGLNFGEGSICDGATVKNNTEAIGCISTKKFVRQFLVDTYCLKKILKFDEMAIEIKFIKSHII